MADKKISALTSATTPLAGTEVLPIVQSSSTVKVSVANLTAGRTQTSNGIVQGTAATGYNFTANTPAAGMTSQLLNWYEEGAWTPAQGAGLTVVGVFSSVGKYIRIGNQVTVYARLYGQTSLACSVGGVLTNNLPFNVGGSPYAIGSLTNASNTATNTVQGATSNVYLNGTVSATTEILFTLTYFV